MSRSSFISFYQVFRCLHFVHIPCSNRHKLAHKASKCVLGYSFIKKKNNFPLPLPTHTHTHTHANLMFVLCAQMTHFQGQIYSEKESLTLFCISIPIVSTDSVYPMDTLVGNPDYFILWPCEE